MRYSNRDICLHIHDGHGARRGQSATIASDHPLTRPVSVGSMSTTSIRHEPAAGSPPNAGMLWLSSWVWTSPVEGSLTTYLVPCGDVSVTRRSPGNSWVIDSDSDSDATIPLPVTGIDDEMPVGSSSGIATGKPAAKNVLLTQ